MWEPGPVRVERPGTAECHRDTELHSRASSLTHYDTLTALHDDQPWTLKIHPQRRTNLETLPFLFRAEFLESGNIKSPIPT